MPNSLMQSTASATRTRNGMVWLPGGTFRMGSDRHYPEEGPAHEVTVDGFWIDETPVTNRDFLKFINATGCRFQVFNRDPGICQRPSRSAPGTGPPLIAGSPPAATVPRAAHDPIPRAGVPR